MGRAKRGRGKSSGGSNKPSPAAAKKKKSSSTNNDGLPLLLIVSRLQDLEKKSDEGWQELLDGNVESSEFGHWIMLTAHLIQRLLQTDSNTDDSSITVLLSMLSYRLATLLVQNPKKLERAMQGSSRDILGRALLAASAGSLKALERANTALPPAVLCAAVMGLDQVVHLQTHSNANTSSTTSSGPNQQVNQFWFRCSRAFDENIIQSFLQSDDFAELCAGLAVTDEEMACFQALVEEAEEPIDAPSPQKKRGRRHKATRETQDASKLQQAFMKLQDETVRMDARVAVKRWASVALVWFCQGQECILQSAWHVLENLNEWQLDCRTTVDDGETIVLANVAVVTCMSRLIRIVWEMGSTCGNRPPTGGWEAYMRVLWPGGQSKKKVKLTRPDVRNLATVLVYHLLQAHQDCIDNNVGSDVLVVNDAETVVVDNTTLLYYPFVHKAVDELSRAASNSVSGSTFTENGQFQDRIEQAAAAFWVQRQVAGNAAVDVRLTNLAITKLYEGLKRLKSMPAKPDGHLSEPKLPKAPAKKKKSSETSTQPCTYAGIFPLDHLASGELPGDVVLSLFWHAVNKSPKKEDTAFTLFSYLVGLVEKCYDTRMVEQPAAAAKKRKPEPAASKKRKKRKKNSGKASDEDPAETKANKRSSSSSYGSIKQARAALASIALDTIQICIESGSEQSSLRSYFSLDLVVRLVELGPILDEIIVRNRENTAVDNEGKTAIESYFAGNVNFAHHEKKLWTSHLSVCLTLGRGKLDYDESVRAKRLGPLRKRVFQSVASSVQPKSGNSGSWPLWLPAPHRILVASNLTTESVQGDKEDRAADQFIVDGVLSSLQDVFQDLTKFPRPIEASPDKLLIDEKVLFSLADSRLFLAAVTRLSSEEQSKCLSSLLGIVQSFLVGVRHDEGEFALLRENEDLSGFVARTITVCTHLAVLVMPGKDLQNELVRVLGQSQSTQLPGFRISTDWYRSETCFMGVYSDWESSELPNGSLPDGGIDEKSAEQLQSILEISFAMGFSTACHDHCFLLFSAWNALGKIPLWKTNSNSIQPAVALPDKLSTLILELREEVCFVHRQIQKSDGNPSLALLARAMDKVAGSLPHSSTSIKRNLRGMISKASTLIDNILEQYVPDDEDMEQELPREIFSLLESLAVYIAFAVACYTKPKDDFFLSMLENYTQRVQKRARGYSSESEITPSDAESDDSQDALLDAVERLHEVCGAFGAVPAFPDWLDTSCRPRDGVSLKELTDVALQAQMALTKLASVAVVQNEISRKRAVKATATASDEDVDARAALAGQLCMLQNYEPGGALSGSQNLAADIAVLCDVDGAFLKTVMSDGAESTRQSMKGWWCSNSAQRVLGQLQNLFRSKLISELDMPELRAGGEWEILMSGTLTSACMSVPPKERQSSVNGKAYDFVASAELWREVAFTALGSLMPAAALLRFGQCKKGRISHPLSLPDTVVESYDSSHVEADASLPVDTAVPKNVRESVWETLSVLARVPGLTSSAVATHLTVDPASFTALQGIESMRFVLTLLSTIQGLTDFDKDEAFRVLPLLVERLVAVVESNVCNDAAEPAKGLARLFPSFGIEGILFVGTIVSADTDAMALLARSAGKTLSSEWEEARERHVSGIASLLWRDSIFANHQTRCYVARLLSSLLAMEHEMALASPSKPRVLTCLVKRIFETATEESLKDLVRSDIYGLPEVGSNQVSDYLCLLFAFILEPGGRTEGSFSKAGILISTLEGSFDEWKETKRPLRKPALNLLLLYALRFNKLQHVGSKLIAKPYIGKREDSNQLFMLESSQALSEFLRETRTVLWNGQTGKKSRQTEKVSDSTVVITKNPPSSRTPCSCSYSAKSGFHEQHWYNCYTCGLTHDKGCCTLCALVCHKGHDVSYARYSSFFCDCGAEDGISDARNRVTCKCLSALTQDELVAAYSLEESKSIGATKSEERLARLDVVLEAETCASIAKALFDKEARKTLDSAIKYGRGSSWVRSSFDSMRQEFGIWISDNPVRIDVQASNHEHIKSYRRLRELLRTREGTSAEPKHLQGSVFSMIRSSRPNTFLVKMSNDSSTELIRRSALSRDYLRRSVLVADSRGRMIIGESSTLLFCTGLPMVNVKDRDETSNSPFPRSSMCVLGSNAIDFSIVGMELSRDNEMNLVLWGINEAALVVLNETASKAEHTVHLPCRGKDHIVKCAWLPGSDSWLIVGSDYKLRVLDGTNIGADQLAETLSIECKSIIRGFAIVKAASGGSHPQQFGCKAAAWKIYVLLSTGEIKCVGLDWDGQSGMTVSHDRLDSKPSVNIPISGIPVCTDSDEVSTAFTKSLGAGKHLDNLAQSRLLLYQADSGVLALTLDETGDIRGSFELIPQSVSSDVLESGLNDNYRIVGPYSRWRELGLVRRNSSTFFRASCVGTRLPAGDEALVCLEFNESETRVLELPLQSSPLDSRSVSLNLEGLGAFSTPFVINENAPLDLSGERKVIERVILCALLSDGSLHFYREDGGSPACAVVREYDGAIDVPCTSDVTAKNDLATPPPLLIFETLKNMAESGEIRFSADGFGSSDNIKNKLSRDNEAFLVSPRREGFWLAVSIGNTFGVSRSTTKATENLVIAAIRIFVGSTSTDCIPRHVFIEGRAVELSPGLKKWYSLILTAEEISLVARNGFVTIGIGQTYDGSNNPVIDAAEVFAVERRRLNKWLPKTLLSIVSSDTPFQSPVTRLSSTERTPHREAFVTSLKALSCLCDSLGFFEPVTSADQAFINQLVRETALDNDNGIADSMTRILSCFEPDEEARQLFCDKAVLAGCSQSLSQCVEKLKPLMSTIHDLEEFEKVRLSVRDSIRRSLLAAVNIAQSRPMNYLKAFDDSGCAPESIVAQAAKLMVFSSSSSTSSDLLISQFVELCLLEMAVAVGSGKAISSRRSFGSFDGLRGLLASPNQSVIGMTCGVISRFCQKYGTLTGTGDEVDLFAAQTMVAYYKCDCCELFPIRELRYSLPDDDHPFDLCQDCFRKGTEFAASKGYREDYNVVIEGKTIGDDTKLTCSELRMMLPVAMQKQSLSELVRNGSQEMDDPDGEQPMDVAGGAEVVQRQQLFDEFMDSLFSGTISLLADAGRNYPGLDSLIALATDLVRHSGKTSRKIDRAKRLAKELANSLSCTLEMSASDTNSAGANAAASELVLFLQAIKDLAVHEKDVRERQAEDEEKKESQVDEHVGLYIWKLLGSSLKKERGLLQVQLCQFLDNYTGGASSFGEDAGTKDLAILRRFDIQGAEKDLADGVFCSRERLYDMSARDVSVPGNVQSLRQRIEGLSSTETKRLLVETSLELLALVAGPNAEGASSWFPLLCGIILSQSAESSQRSLAKRALLQLCGKERELYLAVRDHHSFRFRFQELLKTTGTLLSACRLLKEKARQCGPSWKNKDTFTWDQLQFLDFFGTEDLVAEDVITVQDCLAVTKILNDLLGNAKKRSDNWRRFCGLDSLLAARSPGSHGDQAAYRTASPIATLFSIACSLRGDSQAKALMLIDLAFTRSSNSKNAPEKSDARCSSASSSEDGSEQERAVLGTLARTQRRGEAISIPGVSASAPEDKIKPNLDGLHAFAVRFVCKGDTAEARRAACNVAVKLCNTVDPAVVGKLFKRLIGAPLCVTSEMGREYAEFLALLPSLLKKAESSVVDVPSAAETIQLYLKQQMLAIRHDRANGEYLHLETRTSTSAGTQRKRFELSCCTHCNRSVLNGSKDKLSDRLAGRSSGTSRPASELPKTAWLPEQVSSFSRYRLDSGRDFCTSNEFCSFFSLRCRYAISDVHLAVTDPRGRYVKTVTVYFTPRPVDDVIKLKSEEYAHKWQKCATLNLTRGSSRASCTLANTVLAANIKIEYSEFYERPGGSKAADGTLLIHCPRCTRVVTNAHGVCNNCGEVAFQCRKCRHINYDRLDAFLCIECGYCASGNFKFEVTAGVASNAVAITNNQDLERATQMLTVASKVHDDLRSTLKEKLSALMRVKKKGSKEDESGFASPALNRAFATGSLEPNDKEGDAALTLDKLGKQGSVVKTVARPEGGSSRAGAGDDSSRPLLRLARQWRSDSSPERRRSGDVIIRHLGRDLQIDDEESEIFGLLEGTGGLIRAGGALDPSDPLSRLLASVQNRREQRAAAEGGGERQSGSGVAARPEGGDKAKSKEQTAKENLDICERLYVLMREAERESFLLHRRIEAWRRLERDALAEVGSDTPVSPSEFTPSHCSGCSGTIAVHLLILWLHLFRADPKNVVITNSMIQLLLQEDAHFPRGLQEWKRAAVKEIALHSESGGEIVLNALRLRLNASQDTNCAEILGKILESADDSPRSQQFVALAVETLDSAQSLSTL